MRISRSDRVDVINAYSIDLETMISIAERYSVTRQCIWKILKAEGVSRGGMIQVSCCACGAVIKRYRYRVRKRINLFCDFQCYYTFLEAGNGTGPYVQNRHGQRIARAKVSELFPLLDGYVVHHEDRNTLNNILENLKVFATQGDHIRYHHSQRGDRPRAQVAAIWDGSRV